MHASHPPRFKITMVAKQPTSPAAQDAAALRRFLAQVGGIENGRRALELLALLEGTAPHQDARNAA